MFPLRDDNPTLRTSVITYSIIVINVLIWAIVQGAGTEQALIHSICNLGLIPGELLGKLPPGTHVPLSPTAECVVIGKTDYSTLITHMFLHGSWFHLISNMWFLAVFGDNVEDSMGRLRFILFYLLCGVAAAGAQILFNNSSAVPMVGASGAIGGVMGAYVMLYPRSPVHLLIFLGFFIDRIIVPAYFILGYWFILQLLSALPTLGQDSAGVAFWAHVGGFIAGVILVLLFQDRSLVHSHKKLVFSKWGRL
jgi:membrane associated rhomboid family serine protease